MKYLIDSNIIIYHLNGENIASEFISSNRDKCAISVITYIEVLSFDLTSDEEKNIKDLLESFFIIETSKEIAVQSVRNRKIKKIKVPDNIIASTAQMHGLTLVTHNVEDFTALDVELLDIFSE